MCLCVVVELVQSCHCGLGACLEARPLGGVLSPYSSSTVTTSLMPCKDNEVTAEWRQCLGCVGGP